MVAEVTDEWCWHHSSPGAWHPCEAPPSAVASKVMPHARPTTGPRRRRPRGVVILTELAHALTFIPLLMLGILLLPLGFPEETRRCPGAFRQRRGAVPALPQTFMYFM